MSSEAKETVVGTVVVPEGAEKEAEIKEEVSLVEQKAKGMVIGTEEEYQAAAEFGKQIKAKAKTVTEFFKPMKDSAYQAHKAVCDREKEMLKPLNEAERILKKSMSAYYQRVEQERRALEEKLRRAAEEEKERKLQEAVALEAEGKTEESEAALLDAQITESVGTRPMPVLEAPKVKGVSNSKDWEITGIDSSVVPITFAGMELRPIDEKAVIRMIRASKGQIQIPGVSYKETVKVSLRG